MLLNKLSLALLTFGSSIVCVLAGCGGTVTRDITPPPNNPPPATTYTGVGFSGKVMAGSLPLSGASVQIYIAATKTTNVIPPPLLPSALTTDATGTFNVAAGYICPSAASQIFLVARGGQIPKGSPNSAIVLVTPVGACDNVVSGTQFVLNEATTAASAWALNQFFSAGATLSANSPDAQNLTNAAATAASLANINTGAVPGPDFPAKNLAATGRINTLANLLNTCAASTTAAPCQNLFSTAAASGTSAPTDTLAAALSIVRSPGNNVAMLFAQASASGAFTPALTAAPPDWTLYLNFTGGGMSEPTALGVDSEGNIWVANYIGVASKFSPIGQPVFPSGITGSGLFESYGLAIDAQDNVWIPNQQSGSVNDGLGTITELNSSGQSISGANGFTSGGLNFPTAVAIDSNTNVWVVNNGLSRITLLSSTGQPLSGANGFTNPDGSDGGTGIAFPVSIAVDASHNAWIGNQFNGVVTKMTSSGQVTSYDLFDGPTGLAFDQTGNLWVANFYGDSITELSSSGTILATANQGFSHPQGIAVDGSGAVWVTNYHSSGLFQLAGAASRSPGSLLSPPAGWASDDELIEPYAIAIDASGNLWIPNFGSNVLTEVVGLAVPVRTPRIGPPQAP